jgi:DNA-binding LytR/AlgR family response regulator
MLLQNLNKIIIAQLDIIHLIDPNKILYCQSDNCYTYIHTVEGEKHLVAMSLTKLSKELDTQFIRVNQSFLVNKSYIKNINKKKRALELVNKSQIPFTVSVKNLLFLIKGQ